MKQFKIALVVAFTAVSSFVFADNVSAQQTEQGQSQSQTATCRYTATGAYGQDIELVCDLDQSQAQYQTADNVVVRYVDGEVVYIQPHDVADTALDLSSVLAAAGTIGAGVAATAIKIIKNRVA